jgi:hypothetical protein
MKNKHTFTNSSKDTLIARYLKETSVVDHIERQHIDLKDLGKSMLASMEKLKDFGGFGSRIKP